AAGVNDQLVSDFQYVGLMRMADTDDVRLDVLQPASPQLRVRIGVFIERIARGGMDEHETGAVQGQRLGYGQVGEEANIRLPQETAGYLARHARKVFKPVTS